MNKKREFNFYFFLVITNFLYYFSIRHGVLGDFSSCKNSPSTMNCIWGEGYGGIDRGEECYISCDFVSSNEMQLQVLIVLSMVVFSGIVIFLKNKKQGK
ncbi:MAG: hypothetical protein ACJAS4_003364 [Bacteriovoracaceae bacterium]|jgi:hypothetical protein